jgi:hypothetical protein
MGNEKKNVLNINTYKNLDTNNAYFKHLAECAEKQYDETVPKQMHHIIPKYVFNKKSATPEDLEFLNSPQNIIELSAEDHILAHELLFTEYGNLQDKGATNLLKGLKKESKHIWKILGAEASHIVQKEKGKNFWDPIFQKEMAKRSMERPDALETRSIGGKKGGRNKSRNDVINANQRFVFSYLKEKRKKVPEDEVLCIINCETGGEVLEQLKLSENCTNRHTNINRTSSLLTGTRKTASGWSCEELEDKIQKKTP